VGRSSVCLAGGVSIGIGWGIGRRYLANNVAVFIFASMELLILGVVNGLGFYIGYCLE
jgi:hypothetical protein